MKYVEHVLQTNKFCTTKNLKKHKLKEKYRVSKLNWPVLQLHPPEIAQVVNMVYMKNIKWVTQW